MTLDLYRLELPPLPHRMKGLRVHRGYPVPWFVGDGADGLPDFRVADNRKKVAAVNDRLCWICGAPLLRMRAFVIGPMCAITRTTSEPPCHLECAEYAALACPFLNLREKKRRAGNLPDTISDAPGIPINRQPGVACVWIARSYRPFNDADGGLLFKVGEPFEVRWYREARLATRAEVLDSIESGWPALYELAELDVADGIETAIEELLAARERALAFIPIT